ncbi:FAD-binding oxidoreductase [Terasakiella sp. SH-1]|uniref:NAD(P)/FAD-dependent oxidoreductase n=1 Tax=Terasakiella sp. SH-1 TaxID=2560057 RepID=UPI0010748A9D|nr:FAD-binding oxidoreductase [Terasakiella sp. SH-1]
MSQIVLQSNEHVGSYYAATANDTTVRPQLDGTVEADVCIVGAGFTGLSSALHLAEKGYKVAVLEGSRIGWGASGRNGGQIVNGYSRDMEVIEKRYGREAAVALGDMSLEGGNIIRERIEKYNIECDYKPNNVFAAFTSKQMRELEDLKRNWATHGHDGLELLDRSQLDEHVTSQAYIGGMIDKKGGHIHPLNLCLGQARAIESLGGRVFEMSRVEKIRKELPKPEVETAKGKVIAKYVIVCGNAYMGKSIPELYDKTMPVSTQVICTEPLGEEKCRELLPSDTCVEDCNYMLDYFRCTADNRLIYGGGTSYGGQDPANVPAVVLPHLLKTFPQLKGVKVDYAWSGNFALTYTRIPHFGRMNDRVYYAHGYSGHGVTCSHLAGRLVAEALDGDAKRFDHFAKLPFYPLPGGQLFRVPYNVIGSWWYQMRDKLGI